MHRPSLARLLAALGCLLAIAAGSLPSTARPAAAAPTQGGATLVVDKLSDAVGGGDACTNSPSDCPLRKAIQLANQTTDTTIVFDPAVFSPSSAPIQLNTPLDSIIAQGTRISGAGATVKITFNAAASNKDSIFRLNAHNIRIENLTIYGASRVNIEILQGPDRQITVKNNLIGVAISGSACPNPSQSQNGIVVGVGSVTPNESAAVYIYGNRIECHNTDVQGTAGIVVARGRRISIGINENGQPAANTIRSNKNGIILTDSTELSTIKANTIIDNARSGIYIGGSGNNNIVEENLIGVTAANAINGNGLNGITIEGASNTLIKNNVIGGNKANGISVVNNLSTNTRIESNFIGITRDRQVMIPNGQQAQPDERLKNGIYLGQSLDAPNGYSRQTTVGGMQASQLNIIGNSAGHGIFIDNSDDNLVLFNDIGLYSVGPLPLPNGGAGIKIGNDGKDNQIGTQGTEAPMPLAPEANFIWYNTGAGIEIDSANENKIYGNSLSRNARGISLQNADLTEIYRTRIFDNTGAGIAELGDSNTNFWSEISTSGNRGGGIDKIAIAPVPPRITGVQRLSATTYRLQGTSDSESAVEIYLGRAVDQNEGHKFIGRTTATGTSWSITVTIPANPASVAFLATQTFGSGASRRSSEFSALVMPKVYAPFVRKQ